MEGHECKGILTAVFIRVTIYLKKFIWLKKASLAGSPFIIAEKEAYYAGREWKCTEGS